MPREPRSLHGGPPARPLDARPLHRRPHAVALVALGGALGTAVRAAAGAVLGTSAGPATTGGGWPWATWAVNLTGALLLGVLLEHLARTGPDDGRLRDVRLLAGTGVLGGYTTYSTLALDTVRLAGDGAAGLALLYAGSTLVLGVVAAAVGMAAGARLRRPPGAAVAGGHAHPSGHLP